MSVDELITGSKMRSSIIIYTVNYALKMGVCGLFQVVIHTSSVSMDISTTKFRTCINLILHKDLVMLH